jgi:hypothetical protein
MLPCHRGNLFRAGSICALFALGNPIVLGFGQPADSWRPESVVTAHALKKRKK